MQLLIEEFLYHENLECGNFEQAYITHISRTIAHNHSKYKEVDAIVQEFDIDFSLASNITTIVACFN